MITDEELTGRLRDGFAAQERYVDQARVDEVWARARLQVGAPGRLSGRRRAARRWPAIAGVLAGVAATALLIFVTPRPGTSIPPEQDAGAAPAPHAGTQTAPLPTCRAGDIAFVRMVAGLEHSSSRTQGVVEVTFRAMRACMIGAEPTLTSAEGSPIRVALQPRPSDGSIELGLRSRPYYVFRWDSAVAGQDPRNPGASHPRATIRLAGAKGAVTLMGWRPGTVLRLVEQRVIPAERNLPATNPGDVIHETLKGLTGVNPAGVTFGSDAIPTVDGKQVQLVLVIATNRREGYAWRTDLNGPQPKDPAQAIEWSRNPPKPRTIPVYDSSGTRRIGVFVVGGGTIW